MRPFAEPPPPEGSAHSGEALPPGITPATQDEVAWALREVYDPEIPVNIYDLGLIYDVDIAENGDVDIKMTLTAPACPVAGTLPQKVADTVASLEGVGEVTVELVWDPPWDMSRMSEDARLALNLW